MFENRYAKCKVLGEDNFELLIEYKVKSKGDIREDGYSDGLSYCIVGKDIITGTKVYSLPLCDFLNLKDAASWNAVKRGKLIIKKYEEINIDEMADYLNNMTNKETIEYINRVNNIKNMYSYAIHNEKFESKIQREKEKSDKNNLKISKEKVKRLGKSVN